MRLQLISEGGWKAKIKQGIKQGKPLASKVFKGHSPNPQALYQHCLRGTIDCTKLIIGNTNYWGTMAPLWTNVPPDKQQEILKELKSKVDNCFQKFEAMGYPRELIMNEGFGEVVSKVFSWIGKHATKFAKFLTELCIEIGKLKQDQQSQQYGGYGGARNRDKQVKASIVNSLNSNTIGSFVDYCLQYSNEVIKNNRVNN
jgi:hypothetical protein